MKRSVIVWLSAATITTFCCSTVTEANWPGWRNDGSGVSRTGTLPDRWDSSRNVVWKTPIDGEGISSPIVWGDRVFLTTATLDANTTGSACVLVGLAIGAVLLGLTALGLERGEADKSNTGPTPPRRYFRWAYIVDRLGTSLALLLFLAVLCLMFLDEHFIQPGNDIKPWRWTVSAGIVALVAATGLLRVNSPWRLLGAGAVLGALTLSFLATQTPDGSLHAQALTGASLAVVLWWCVLFFSFRNHAARSRTVWQSTAFRGVAAVLVLTAAAWQFWSIRNMYLKPTTEWLRQVVCVDADTGDVLWRREVFRTGQLRRNPLGSYATPTPVTDGRLIIAAFGVGTACLDMDGGVQWKTETPEYADRVRHGASCSPLLLDGVVIQATFPETENPDVETEKEKYALLAALDAQTGDVVWECCPTGGNDVYSTPYAARHGGVPAVFVVTRGQLLAYSLADGGLLASWSVPIRQPIASVVADEHTVYVPSGRQFGSKGVVAVGIESANDPEGMSHIRWTVSRRTPKIPSPVLFEGALYMVTDEGVASCIDSKTGESLWKKRLDGAYHASVVCGDGKVYFTSTDGTTTVVRASREYEVLAQNCLNERVQASPAISDGRLYVRGEHHLYCIAEAAEVRDQRSGSRKR